MKSVSHLYKIIRPDTLVTTLYTRENDQVMLCPNDRMLRIIEALDHKLRMIKGTKQRLSALEQMSLDILQEHYDYHCGD